MFSGPSISSPSLLSHITLPSPTAPYFCSAAKQSIYVALNKKTKTSALNNPRHAPAVADGRRRMTNYRCAFIALKYRDRMAPFNIYTAPGILALNRSRLNGNTALRCQVKRAFPVVNRAIEARLLQSSFSHLKPTLLNNK